MALIDFQKLRADGHVTIAWYLPNAFANFEAPTATELNAAAPTAAQFSKSISWNDLDFGIQASNSIDDPSIVDVSNVTDRGAAQYGGGISFYYPGAFDDNTNAYSLTYDAIAVPRTLGFLVVRVDGAKPSTQAFAEGDYVHVLRVQTDAQTNVITGEEAFRYTVNFLNKGALAVYTVVQGAVASAVVVSGDAAMDVGDIQRATGSVAAREYTNGLVWTSSDTDVATVSNAGVITAVSAGSATITGAFEPTGESDDLVITIT